MRRYAPLAAFWLLYFGCMGVFFPYFALYLSENAALTGLELGLVQAAFPLVGVVAQPLWGQVADRTGSRVRLLVAITLLAALGQLVLAAATGFVPILLASILLAFFATAVVPSVVAVSMAMLGAAAAHAFGYVRVWGTVGFLVAAVAFPALLHRWQEAASLVRSPGGPSEPGLELMFVVASALTLLAALVGLALAPAAGAGGVASPGEWRRLASSPAMRRLLLVAFLAFLCLQGPITLFPVYVRALGGSIDTVGRMWVAMIALEVPLVLAASAIMRRLGARGLLALGIAAGAVRWLLCGLTGDLGLVWLAQLLHGPIVTGLLVAGVIYVEGLVPERLRSTAQALYSTFGLGLGGFLSSLLTGWLLDRGPHLPYLVAGAGAALVALLALVLLPSERPAAAT